jgi:phosphoglycerate kinase
MNLKRIENIEVKSRRVFVRVDLNLPIENGKIKDSIRIQKFLPTLEVLSSKGAKILIGTHFGSPENSSSVPSTKPIFEVLQNHFKQVSFA